MKTSIPDPRTWPQILSVLQDLAMRRPRCALLEEAEVELWSLYRSEQADLLLEAARLRSRAQGIAPETASETSPGWQASPDTLLVDPNAGRANSNAGCADSSAWRADLNAWRDDLNAWRDEWNAWRSQAAECAAACAYDGYLISPGLVGCLILPLPRWPAARELADEARRLGAAGGVEA